MLITNEVIQKFWGNGNGFVVTSIKRWGGFISDESILEQAYHKSLVSAIKLRDKAKAFEDELHMVNYLMRVCYWSWCDAVTDWKQGDGENVISESKLIPKDADPDFKPSIIEPYELPVEPNMLIETSKKLVEYKFGYASKKLFEMCILEHTTLTDAAEELGLSYNIARARLRVLTNYLKKNLRRELV